MTVTVLESPLETGLGGDIPCQMRRGVPRRRCGQPAVVRVQIICACGNNGVYFACAQCWEHLRNRNYICSKCSLTRASIKEC